VQAKSRPRRDAGGGDEVAVIDDAGAERVHTGGVQEVPCQVMGDRGSLR